ncbi:hypothetical protein JD793_001820 [Citrobacter braakii]|nr:hypothetical protein [Citrobacter braakii]
MLLSIFLLVVVLTTTVLFNWQFSVHRWPDMPFFVACCIGVLLMFATIFPVALCLAEWFHLETYELLEVFFDIAPEAIIILLIAIPANLIIWKWIFNKPDNK